MGGFGEYLARQKMMKIYVPEPVAQVVAQPIQQVVYQPPVAQVVAAPTYAVASPQVQTQAVLATPQSPSFCKRLFGKQ